MRTIHLKLLIVIGLGSTTGCVIEAKSSSPYQPVSGKVTYKGTPIKLGRITLLPIAPNGTSATGNIADGVFKSVTTKNSGDGAKIGDYIVTVTAYDEAYLEEPAKRGPNGPDPKDVNALFEKIKDKIPIPPHYGNVKTSNLRAEIVPGENTLSFDLKDE